MKIVIAPDSFKGSLSALEAAQCIESGFRCVFADACYSLVPLSDGGEGFVDCLVNGAEFAVRQHTKVSDPLGRSIEARYAFIDQKTAVLDFAAASGLTLLKPGEFDPMRASSYGTGLLIREAVRQGATRLILGLGGSASNDAGIGLLQALGFDLLDASGRTVGPGGASLGEVREIRADKVPESIREAQFILAVDVSNPLLGSQGASRVFGPQKGATPAMAEALEAGMAKWEEAVHAFTGKRLGEVAGAGAAGGTAFSLLSLLKAEIVSGLDFLLDFIDFTDLVRDADLVITGEGRFDAQSQFGKVPVGVARRVKRDLKIPVIAINGSIEGETAWAFDAGLDAIFSSIQSVQRLEDAIAHAKENLSSAAERAARAIAIDLPKKCWMKHEP